ncbi:hypothetical protein CHLRE_17g744097v5 [Chlamydomonas reinhardtii]|uniref:Glycosyl transferase CAP10 domain-containing protein n=1 Tax=Chlamydomonas reinhardtii TaxID=3055 RepID=A0A2K3CRY0_CHLRE|nr:uncharacterized protein CHLRE_17g744097v5 [Chlamydomonas reinhardtii]PNW71044.1 hypothetical protein CHLRE_17g744097v5 [Chlamydomonas reinhardtii]
MIRNISLVCDKHVRHLCNFRVVRVMIKDGEVYLNSVHPEYKLGPTQFAGFLAELYEASKVFRLPDVEFAYNGDDDANWAFDWKDRGKLQTNFHGGPFPLVAWSKSERSSAILIPDSGAFRCMHDGFDNFLERLDAINKVEWSTRKQVAFGRWTKFCPLYMLLGQPRLPSGEPYKCPRAWLPAVSNEAPELLDAGFVHGGDDPPPKGDPRYKEPIPISHQVKYRYLVSTDGVATSRKMEVYFLFGSLVIKSASDRMGYFYDALRPDEHFVTCLNSSARDILDVVRWARSHDAEARRIAETAQRFAVEHLRRSARLCQIRTVIEELGRRMRYTPDCSRRELCIPLGHFVSFLSKHGWEELVTRYPPSSAAVQTFTTSSDYAIANLISNKQFWPRDNDFPPLEEEPYFGVPRM